MFAGRILTVDALAKLYDLSEGHCFPVTCGEMGQNAGTECNLLVQIRLCKTVLAQFKFRRLDVRKVRIENS